MKEINTKWLTPKTNIFSALWCLKSALASGHNARLIKMKNEDCEYPIKIKHVDEDFRNYEFNIGKLRTRQEVIDDQNMDDFQKHLTLNYKTCYGSEEAMNTYYETGKLSLDNFRGMGRSHLVKIDDIIFFFTTHPDVKIQKRADNYIKQYKSPSGMSYNGFYDHYKYKHGSPWAVKQFKHKLWVVELLDSKPTKIPNLIKFLNFITYPLKFIPQKSVLRMSDYTNYSFRIGDVIHGFEVEFQIPKKFSF